MKIKFVLKRQREDDCDEAQDNKYGHEVAWRRGKKLGKGSVHLAFTFNDRFPVVMAVKSAELDVSKSIQLEKKVLSNLSGCSNIIRCFGDEIAVEHEDHQTKEYYNLLLEYASGGSLADRIYKSGQEGLPESEVRCYTRCILQGLNYIHEHGYIHRDLKPENVLLVPKSGVQEGKNTVEFIAKICDFGMAKIVSDEEQTGKRKLQAYWAGTPMYLSPEAAREGVQDARGDIWSLGCVVLKMLTGKPVWNVRKGVNFRDNILKKLVQGKQLPKIPHKLSHDAKTFLKCCLERNVSHRLSAKTLLTHPFVKGLDDEFKEGREHNMDGWRERSCSLCCILHHGSTDNNISTSLHKLSTTN